MSRPQAGQSLLEGFSAKTKRPVHVSKGGMHYLRRAGMGREVPVVASCYISASKPLKPYTTSTCKRRRRTRYPSRELS